ncbi:hypothetical protein BO83DRAFT_327519, partial [Aspergillus eucalypticola CBS 122712]
LSEITYHSIYFIVIIYNNYPRVDYLYYVNKHIITGVHWSKKEDKAGVLYFYLTKY